jgi:hypothetical protein
VGLRNGARGLFRLDLLRLDEAEDGRAECIGDLGADGRFAKVS